MRQDRVPERLGRFTSAPRGTLANGYAQVTADQTGITAVADLTSLTVTVVVGSGRRIRVTGCGEFDSSVGAGGHGAGYIYADGAQVQIFGSADYNAAGWKFKFTGSVILTPTAGSHTYKLRADMTANTLNLRASATNPAFIVVEDIGR